MAARKKRESEAEANERVVEPRFGKGQIVASEKYRNQRDLVNALLDHGETYTYETVDGLIEQYKKGLVK